MQDLHTGRTCGECGACCKVFAVPEAGKNDLNWCPHHTAGKGCNIYSKRPFACQKFACLWLNGKGEPGDRPDRLGVMMDNEDFDLDGELICILHLWHTEEGSTDSPRVRAIAQANVDAGNIVIHHRPISPLSYALTVSMSRSCFTPEKIERFTTEYRRE